jgi:glyoxylase-like metal-dependent hydrolase (beta-lactamase superfamily II)/rhodanese-related sulfurtransferase
MRFRYTILIWWTTLYGGICMEIEAGELKQKIDRGDDVYILDVRTPQEYAAWKITYNKYRDLPLIPIDQLFSSTGMALRDVPKDKEIITVCAHGNRSMMAARLLSKFGFNVKSVKGGMAQWNNIYDIAMMPDNGNLPATIWQVRRISKGCIGYIVSSKIDRNAVIIDPTCAIEESFMKIANDNHLNITKVIDTHMHADHVSGVSRLARVTGADIYVSSSEGYNIQHDIELTVLQVKDNDKISISDGIHLLAIHVPGHTKGSMSLALSLEGGNHTGHYLFTGDTLFVDGIGRPDLRDKAEEDANDLYESYHQRIFKNFPNDTTILPTHFNTGSIVLEHEKPIYDTLEAIKKRVKLLSETKEEFIKALVGTTSPRPSNYKTITEINKNMIPCDQIELGDLEAGPNSCALKA